jgi:hypothetical protein
MAVPLPYTCSSMWARVNVKSYSNEPRLHKLSESNSNLPGAEVLLAPAALTFTTSTNSDDFSITRLKLPLDVPLLVLPCEISTLEYFMLNATSDVDLGDASDTTASAVATMEFTLKVD